MVTPVEFLIFGLISLFTFFIGAYVTLRWLRPVVERLITTYTRMIPAQVGKVMADTIENIDIGDIAGQLGAGGGESNPLAGLMGALGGGGGDLGGILSALSQIGAQTGQKTTKGRGRSEK